MRRGAADSEARRPRLPFGLVALTFACLWLARPDSVAAQGTIAG